MAMAHQNEEPLRSAQPPIGGHLVCIPTLRARGMHSAHTLHECWITPQRRGWDVKQQQLCGVHYDVNYCHNILGIGMVLFN